MNSTYYGWPGRFLFVGRGGRSDLHAHIMLQIVISLDRPFRIRQRSDEPYQSYQACIIASHELHQLVMTNRHHPGFILWLDPEESLIARWQPPSPILPLEIDALLLQDLAQVPDNCRSADHLTKMILQRVLPFPDPPPPDPRIQHVCDRVKQLVIESQTPVVDELASEVSLSPSRLMHLFKAEVGFTIRRYVLWQRKLHAIRLLAGGISLTEAAHAAGFADSAHLTRTYRQMSGVAPSEIWQNSRFVQVMDCSSE